MAAQNMIASQSTPQTVSLDERKSITSKIFDMVNKKQEKANFSQASNHGIPNGMAKKGERGPRKQKSKYGQNRLC